MVRVGDLIAPPFGAATAIKDFSIIFFSLDEDEDSVETSTGTSERSSTKKYEQLTRDLDVIMNELSATQASDIRNPVISF